MDETPTIRLRTGHVLTIRRTGAGTGGDVFEFEALLPPRSPGPPGHWHRVEQETFDVLAGTLHVRIGRERLDLGPGQSVAVPPGVVHTFANHTDEPVRVLNRETPAGQLEAQLRLLASAGRIPPLLRMAEVNADHGCSLVFAGVPDRPQRLVWHALAGLSRLRHRFG